LLPASFLIFTNLASSPIKEIKLSEINKFKVSKTLIRSINYSALTLQLFQNGVEKRGFGKHGVRTQSNTPQSFTSPVDGEFVS
jgi:hypothetical protein